jgi:hypothetical protein
MQRITGRFRESLSHLCQGAYYEQNRRSLASAGTGPLVLISAALAAYFLYILLAVFARRYMFGDMSWFLIKLLTENHVAHWNNGSRDFFVGRIGAFLYQQEPTLAAARLGIRNLNVLATVYGSTLFSYAPLSLAICYRYALDKRYILFPLLSLFAGSINSEGYIVSETHLFVSLFWAALFILLYADSLSRWTLVIFGFVSAPLILCYETMLMFGVILLAACAYRLIASAKPPIDRSATRLAGAWYTFGIFFAGLSVLYPRDAANLGGFVRGFGFVLAHDHIGARVSSVVLLLLLIMAVVPEQQKKTVNILFYAAMAASPIILIYILAHPGRTSLDVHAFARSINAIIPLLVALLLLASHFRLLKIDDLKYNKMLIVVACLGISQVGWHLVATTQWSNMLTLLRSELRTHTGVIYFDQSLMSKSILGREPIRNLHADWPLLPMSILLADGGNVKSIVLPPPGIFTPFDPFHPASLPDLSRFGVHYEKYIAAVMKFPEYKIGQPITFGSNGDAESYERGGWWQPEPWGTWSMGGTESRLVLNIEDDITTDLILQVYAGAFVPEKQPTLNARIFVNDILAGEWPIRFEKGDVGFRLREISLKKEVLRKAKPLIVTFRTTSTQSPYELGLSDDARKLGMAFVRVTLESSPNTLNREASEHSAFSERK